MNLVGCWAFFIIVSFLSSLATANIVGNDTQNFNPITSGLDFVTVQSTETLFRGIVNFGLFANHGQNVLPEAATGGFAGGTDSMSMLDFNIGAGLSTQMDAGISFSTLMAHSSDHADNRGQFSKNGLNEVRFNGKYRFRARNPWGVALIASLNLNQAKNNPFLGEGAGPTLNMEAAFDRAWASSLVGFNVGYRFRAPGSQIAGSFYEPLSNQLIASAAFSHYFPRVNMKAVAELLASRLIKTSSYVGGESLSCEGLAGIKYDRTQNLSFHGGVGHLLAPGLFVPEWRLYAGVNFTIGVADTPPPAPVLISPDAPAVELPSTMIRLFKGYTPADIAKLKTVPFDEITAQHEFLLRQEVPPEPEKVIKPPFEVLRLNGFDFDTGSAFIKPEHKALLDKLAAYLKAPPQVLKFRIEGHTDSMGVPSRNETLSQNRADALKAALAERGVNVAVDVEANGFGASRPIADNGNFQGRRQNRRTEVRLLRSLDEGVVKQIEELRQAPPGRE